MSHCPGCGGNFRQGHAEGFEHILGCGWADSNGDDRATPSNRGRQKRIIKAGLVEAGLAGATNEQAELFIIEVLRRLDAYQGPRP